MKSDTFLTIQDLKLRVSRWRLLAVVAAFLLLVSSAGLGFRHKGTGASAILKIKLDGMLESSSYDLEKIRKIKAIAPKAIVLDIDSGGGEVAISEALYTEFLKLSKEIPVVSVINSTGASGAYMVAMAGERIFARNTSMVGSIGVLLQSFEVTDMAKKLGITLTNYKSSKLKAAPNPLEKINPDVDMVLSQQINDIYDYFLSIFIERRKIAMPEAQEIANGQTYTGRQALEFGLVDEIGGMTEALDYLQKKVDCKNIVDFSIKADANGVKGLLKNVVYNGSNRVMAVVPSIY